MESSPLIKAHDHARAASTATHTSDTTVAINEHTRAAGEFANAAKNTTSVEALRTLKLLEQHHQRLSELLQAPLQPPTSQRTSENDSQGDEKEDSSPAMPVVSSSKSDMTPDASSEKGAQPMPTLTRQPRYPSRDLGASIASNLASARGIRSKYRSQPLVPSVSNTEAPGNMEAASRRAGSRTKMQNMLESSDNANATPSPEKVTGPQDNTNESTASNDEGFSRFYSAFGSIINKISAPLAFAGLPLVNEEQSQEQSQASTSDAPVQRRNRHKPSPPVSAEPDLKKIYSKAALRAVARDGQSATDSFYVVPTSGHTASYASILTFADKEKRRMGASGHGEMGSLAEDQDEDDFVDAKESQAPHPPAALKKRASRRRSDKELANVVEELLVENKSLKDMLDKLSKRLHAFESMSQNSGMRLAESMRLMRPGSPLSSGSKPGSVEDTLGKENRELKERFVALTKDHEDIMKANRKLSANLERYREKWDQLKAGARLRRAGGVQGSSEAADESLRSPSLT